MNRYRAKFDKFLSSKSFFQNFFEIKYFDQNL